MTAGKRSPRFARNAIANWIAFLFTALVGFFLSPFLVEQLGATRYGVWTLVGGLVGYLGLLDLGIRQAVNRFTAHHHAAGDHQESSLIISASLRLFGVLGIIAVVLSGVLATFAPALFNIPHELVHEAQMVITLGGLTIAIALVSGVFGGVISGLERFDIQCGLEVVITLLRTVAIVFALLEGYGLVALAWIHLASTTVNLLAQWVIVHRIYAQLSIRLTGILGPHIRTILSFSAWLTVLYALGKIIYYSDALVIGAFQPIEAVTFFAIAGSLCVYAKEVPRALSYLMTPRVSALTSVGSERVGELILGVARIATLASTPIAITFLLRGESFISLWMGPAYGPASGEVLRILAVVVLLDASRSVVIASLTGMAKQQLVIPGMVVEAVVNLALSLALVHSFGIAGVALGTLIPNVLVSLFYIPHCLSRATNAPVGQFLGNVLLRPVLACLPFAAATYLLERFMPASNLAIFFVQVALCLPLVPAAAWFPCLTPEERNRVRAAVRARLGR